MKSLFFVQLVNTESDILGATMVVEASSAEEAGIKFWNRIGFYGTEPIMIGNKFAMYDVGDDVQQIKAEIREANFSFCIIKSFKVGKLYTEL